MNLDKKIATRQSYGEELAKLGEENSEIVVLDADLSTATKTEIFAEKFPDRFINVGIAEQNLMGIAAGLSTFGKIPFASTFAVFAAGKKPTGSSDPLGVRRAALGVIRTVLDSGLNIDVDKYIKECLKILPVQKDCADEVNEFFIQRMIIFLSEKYNKNVLEACAVKNPLKNIADYAQRVQLIKDLDAPLLVENANRVIRILKDNTINTGINEKYFKEDAEKSLYNEILKIEETKNYQIYLQKLEQLNPFVTKFFNDVLVMDNDENVKNNRLALLTLLKEKYNFITDFAKL